MKTKVRFLFAGLAVALLSAALLTACSNPLHKSAETAGKDTGTGTGTIIVNLGTGARALIQADEIEQMLYTITVISEDDYGSQTQEGIAYGSAIEFKVQPGRWTVTVDAFLDGTLRASGETEEPVTVIAGERTPAKVTMKLVTRVGSWGELVDAIENANTSGVPEVIVITNNLQQVTDPAIINDNKNITLRAETNVQITRASDPSQPKSLFTVEEGGRLTLGRPDGMNGTITIDGNKGDTPHNSSLIMVDGTLTMYDGIILRNNTVGNDSGGGVTVNDSGTFTMHGGTISGNVSTYGGGVYVNSGIFTMSGGEITGNKVNNSGDGGGVCVKEGGTFEMTGGEIKNNNASESGGGVAVVAGSTFTMTGGEITGGNSALWGGGVRVTGSTFTMSGGTISGNTGRAYAGGVYALNSTSGSGGTAVILGGAAVIEGNKNSDNENSNVYLEGCYIQIGAPFTEPAEIWVQTNDTNGVIIQSGVNEDNKDYFVPDDGFFSVDDGRLILKVPTAGLAFELINNNTAYRVRKPTTGTISGELVIPSHHEEKPVTEIGSASDDDGAFSGTDITAVYIPATVTSIGGRAFEDCFDLTSITIPTSVTTVGDGAFWSCIGLTSITIPASVTFIGEEAFANCTSLTSITIPATVTNIYAGAFVNWTSGQKIFIERYASQVAADAAWASGWRNGNAQIYYLYYTPGLEFQGGMGPNGLTNYIAHKGSVTSGAVVIPSHYRPNADVTPLPVTEIGDGAFSNTGIIGITIPETVTVIGEKAFEGCTSLAGITLPASVRYINSSAFSGCTALASITLPVTIVSVNGSSAFNGWTINQKIYIEGQTTEWEQTWQTGCNATVYYLYGTEGLRFMSISGGTAYSVQKPATGTLSGAVVIPSHRPNATGEYLPVTEIGDEAFSYCFFSSITIPASVTTIGDMAFAQSYELKTIIFAENSQLQTIGDYAFEDCQSLTGITIPASVTTISNNAFSGCSGLVTITVAGNNQNYASQDNILYNKAKTTVIQAAGKITSATLPASVTTINDWAFYGCIDLTTVTFEEGSQLTTIGDSAFNSCSGLTSIIIPAGVTSIGEGAFSGWTAGQTIYVVGYADGAVADAVWGNGWRTSCSAQIEYWK